MHDPSVLLPSQVFFASIFFYPDQFLAEVTCVAWLSYTKLGKSPRHEYVSLRSCCNSCSCAQIVPMNCELWDSAARYMLYWSFLQNRHQVTALPLLDHHKQHIVLPQRLVPSPFSCIPLHTSDLDRGPVQAQAFFRFRSKAASQENHKHWEALPRMDPSYLK